MNIENFQDRFRDSCFAVLHENGLHERQAVQIESEIAEEFGDLLKEAVEEAKESGIQKAIDICMEVYSEAMNNYHDNMKFDDRESNEVIAGCAINIKSKIEDIV